MSDNYYICFYCGKEFKEEPHDFKRNGTELIPICRNCAIKYDLKEIVTVLPDPKPLELNHKPFMVQVPDFIVERIERLKSNQVSLWEKIWYTINKLIDYLDIVIKLMPFILAVLGFIKQIEGIGNMNNNLKTTVAGIVLALAMLAKTFFKIEISEEVQVGFVSVVVFFWSFFTNKPDTPASK